MSLQEREDRIALPLQLHPQQLSDVNVFGEEEGHCGVGVKVGPEDSTVAMGHTVKPHLL